MRNVYKKFLLIIVITVLVMLFSISTFAFNDTKNSWAKKEIDFISELGIVKGYEDSNFYPDYSVKRAEIVSIALRMMKLDGVMNGEDSLFYDVPSSHWASGEIKLASELGIVNGDGNGSFRPESSVSYQEAAKIFVNMLGLEYEAIKAGGFPHGYIIVASRHNLFNFTNIDASQPASRAAIAVMAYNTLNTPVTQITYDGEIIKTDVSMLSIYFNSNMGEGLLTQTSSSGLNSEPTEKGYVTIDNVLYKCDFDCSELLGNRVRFSYEEDNGIKRIFFIEENALKQKKMVLSDSQVENLSGLFTSSGKLVYWESEKRSASIKFSPALYLIYNGKYTNYTEAGLLNLNIENGTYEAIDTNRDNIYDCLKITEYTDYYVNSAKETDGKMYIIDSAGNSVSFNNEDGELQIRIMKGSEKINFADINEGCIASVALSSDSKIASIIISEEKVEGEITEVSTEGVDEYVYIAGNDYMICNKSVSNTRNLTLRTKGTFYINAFGKISYSDIDEEDGEHYGFLTDIGSGAGRDVEVYMLTTDNSFVYLKLADKVKLYRNGTSSSVNPKEILALLDKEPAHNDIRNAYTQVVKYKLNSDGEISVLKLARDLTTSISGEVGDFYVVEDEFVASKEYKWYYSNKLFDQKWKITEDTVCFKIPWIREGQDYTRYESGRASRFFKDSSYYQVKLFDLDNEKGIGAVMLTLTSQDKEFFYELGVNSPVMVVDSLRTVIEDGEAVNVVSGIVDGQYVTVPVDDEYLGQMSSSMKKFGSVIMYETNGDRTKAAYYEDEKEAIVLATLLCEDLSTPMRMLWERGTVELQSAQMKTTYGVIKSVVGYTVTLSLPDDMNRRETDIFLNENTRVIIVDEDSEKLDIGNVHDIGIGDRVFVRQRYNRIREVVVYR